MYVYIYIYIYIYIYTGDTDFSAKRKAAGEVPKGAILVTADVVGLYPTS